MEQSSVMTRRDNQVSTQASDDGTQDQPDTSKGVDTLGGPEV